MTEEEKLRQLLSGAGQDDAYQAPDLNALDSLSLSGDTLTIDEIDVGYLTETQQALEAEIALFPTDESLWHQLIQSIKVISAPSLKGSSHATGDGTLQDRAWKDKYLRNIYRRMLTGPFKYMAWLWIEYLLFEASLLGFQLPSATIMPLTQKTTASSAGGVPDMQQLEEAFSYVLGFCCSPHVWFVYLNFLKKKISLALPDLSDPAEQKRLLVETYERALTSVGLDIYAGPIWSDYIAYLKSEKVEGHFEEQVRMDQFRKVYQRAVVIPHTHLEVLWKEYDAFENQLNKVTAKKILNEKSPLHMNARVAFKELKNRMDGMQKSRLDLLMRPEVMSEQEAYWQKIFVWEKENTCLKLEDPEVQWKRQDYAYRAALSPLCQSRRVWLLYALFKQQGAPGMSKEAAREETFKVLRDACAVLPRDLAVHYYLADVLESAGGPLHLEAAKKVYDDLLDAQILALEGIQSLIHKRKTLMDSLTQRKAQLEEGGGSDKKSSGDDRVQLGERIEYLMASLPELQTKLKLLEKENNLTVIQMMRFMRRREGVAGARPYFARARKTAFCSPLVFLDSAKMEFFMGKEPIIAFKIFELGIKKFATNMDLDEARLTERFTFFKEYLTLLLHQMDEANALALFERLFAIYMPTDPAIDATKSKDSMLLDTGKETDKIIYLNLMTLLDLLIEHEKSFGGSNALSNLTGYLEKRNLLERKISGKLTLDLDPVNWISTKSSFMQLSIVPPAERTDLTASSSEAPRKRLFQDIDLQPTSVKRPPLKRSTSNLIPVIIPPTVPPTPIVTEILQFLGDFMFDLPQMNIDVLMQALSNVHIPPVLGPLKNPPLRPR